MMRALATAVVLTAHVGPASAVWQQNMCCRIGGKRLEAGDEKELAKFDIVLTNNMFYQDIQNDTWSAISKINPATKVFACARSLEACTQAAPQHLGRPPAPALESGILRRHAPLFFVRHCTGRRVLADRDTLAADNEDTNKMPESNNVARWNVSRGLEQGSLNLDNPDLFLLGKDGKRIYIGTYPHTWLMDVGADRWRQYFIDATVADNFNRPWSTQGQYLDNCLSTLGNLHSSGFSEPPRKYLAPGTWETAMTGFLGTLSDAFKAHSVPTMANRGATDTEDGVRAWLTLDQNTAHASVGQLEEGAFAVRWGSSDVQFYPLEDWERQVGLMGQIRHSALMYQSHSKLLSTGPPGRDNFGVSVGFWDVLWYRCASLALSPLPLIFSYKSETSLCGAASGVFTSARTRKRRRATSRSPRATTTRFRGTMSSRCLTSALRKAPSATRQSAVRPRLLF